MTSRPVTLKSEIQVGPGDCVINLPDREPHPQYFVVARRDNRLIAIRLRTIKKGPLLGRLAPTGATALDASKVVIIIGRPNEWSAKLTEADYERFAARAKP